MKCTRAWMQASRPQQSTGTMRSCELNFSTRFMSALVVLPKSMVTGARSATAKGRRGSHRFLLSKDCRHACRLYLETPEHVDNVFELSPHAPETKGLRIPKAKARPSAATQLLLTAIEASRKALLLDLQSCQMMSEN